MAKSAEMNSVVISSDEEDNATKNINFVAVPTAKKITITKRKSSENADPLKIKLNKKNQSVNKLVNTVVVLNDDGEDEEYQLDLHTKSKSELEYQKSTLPKPLSVTTTLSTVNNKSNSDTSPKTKVTNSTKATTSPKAPFKTIVYPPPLPKLTPKPNDIQTSVHINNLQAATNRLLSPDVTVQKKNSQTLTTILTSPNITVQENNLQTITTILPSDNIHPITTTIVPPEVALQSSMLSSSVTNGVTLTPVKRNNFYNQSSALVSSANNSTTDSVTLIPLIKVRDIDSLKENANDKSVNNSISGLNSSNLVLLNANTSPELLGNVQYVCLTPASNILSGQTNLSDGTSVISNLSNVTNLNSILTNLNNNSNVSSMSSPPGGVGGIGEICTTQQIAPLFQISNVLSLAEISQQAKQVVTSSVTSPVSNTTVTSTTTKRKRKSNPDPNKPKSKRGRKKKNVVATNEIISLDDDEDDQQRTATPKQTSTSTTIQKSPTPQKTPSNVNNQKNVEVIALDSDSDTEDITNKEKNTDKQPDQQPETTDANNVEPSTEEQNFEVNGIFIIENSVENINISSSDSENDENTTAAKKSSEKPSKDPESNQNSETNSKTNINDDVQLESTTPENGNVENNTTVENEEAKDQNQNCDNQQNTEIQPSTSTETENHDDVIHIIQDDTDDDINQNQIDNDEDPIADTIKANKEEENTEMILDKDIVAQVSVSNIEQIDNENDLEIPNLDTETNSNNELFEKFLNICVSEIIPAKSLEIINKSINKIKKRYQSASVNYINSDDFSQLLQKCISKIEIKPISVIISFKEVLQQLKNNQDQQNSVTGNNETLTKETLAKIHKLEKFFKILQKKVRELEMAELDVSKEWDENSNFMKVDRYLRKLCKVYEKICQLRGQNKNEGRITLTKLNFQGSQHPQINQAISKLYNKNFEFPDLHAVDKCVRRCIKRNNLNFTEIEIETEVREMFKLLGRKLQKRRQKELHEDLKSYMTDKDDDNDPASHDADLDKKLRESYKISQDKYQEIFKKYTLKQEHGEEIENEESDSNDSENSNNVESSDVDDDDDNNVNDKNDESIDT